MRTMIGVAVRRRGGMTVLTQNLPSRAFSKRLGERARSTPNRQLALAAVGFGLNFWAWALIGPLGTHYREALRLSSLEQSLLVAVPVIVGSLGRIPVGALTDRVGARRMFPLASLLTIVPVLYIGLAADSYPSLLAGGVALGLGGTTFAIGVPHVNGWFRPERRGAALGVFGMGMGGTAISAFTTVALTEHLGLPAPFVLVACLLALFAVTSAVWLRNAPGRPAGSAGLLRRTWETFSRPVTLQLSFLYAVGFGGFVAFSVYLPTYLKNAYDLSQSAAAMRTAGFVVLAVLMRPVGGWLSDRLHPARVLVMCFSSAAVLAGLAAAELPLLPGGTVAFLGLAAALGAASGACFALVARVTPAAEVGSVTGVVGAAGGLGGFVPPLVMGAFYGWFGDYSGGFLLLAITAAVAALFTRAAMSARSSSPTDSVRDGLADV